MLMLFISGVSVVALVSIQRELDRGLFHPMKIVKPFPPMRRFEQRS
ncbi:MAG: hypothetical protein P1V21_14225 [Rhizobiaceae bacterium]|nr:hypothetical protein [Rhizobiaceae bacterium]